MEHPNGRGVTGGDARDDIVVVCVVAELGVCIHINGSWIWKMNCSFGDICSLFIVMMSYQVVTYYIDIMHFLYAVEPSQQ